VIWLHNIHGYYIHIGLLFDYLRTCGKQIFWMLHDCWTFTGHCSHFSFVGCDKWKTGCHHCPQKGQYPASLVLDNSKNNYEKKRALFTGIPNMTLITPSYWLANLVKQSFLQEYPVEVVYHTVDTEVFCPTESDFRQRYGLDGKKIALGVASIWDDRKGLYDFVQLATMLDSSWRIVLVGIKPEQGKILPDNVITIPRTNSQKELAEIYSAVDVFVNPSREETFGLTTVEALSCGTQAVVYKGTACEEIVEKFGGTAVSVGANHLHDILMKL
jgi:glycosyltransferase involved in cell wall biosynthesis